MKSITEKRVSQILAILLALLFLFGCRPESRLPGCGPKVVEVPVPDTDTIDVTDCMDRTVSVPKNVSRIACLYAYAGHVCVLLHSEDKIVAVVNGLKRDQLMLRKLPAISDMPCPYNSGAVNIEELAAASPDLIFLRTENLADPGEIEKLDGLGVPYVVIDYVTMEDQIRSIEAMGKALGEDARALAYTAYYRSTVEMVKDRLSAVPEENRVRVYHSVNEVVRTDIPGTLSFEILDAAGCRNVVSSADELRLDGGKGMTTVEQIYVWDPDVVLVTEPDAAAYFRTNEKFSGLRAVREGTVFQLPVGISRWAHPGSLESPLATLYIAKLLYPDLFYDIDFEKELTDFYERFFDITLSEEDISAILSGEGMRAPKEGKNEL